MALWIMVSTLDHKTTGAVSLVLKSMLELTFVIWP
jgi:hypothetical protein